MIQYLIKILWYGFTYKDKKLVINEEQAEAVRKIFEEYIAGKGTTEIAKLLTESKIPNKNGKEKWSASAISYIISNVRYKFVSFYQNI